MFFGPLARTMPLLISVPGLILCFAQFIIDLKSHHGETDGQQVFSSGEAKTTMWFVGFILGISLLGFDYGSPLVVAAYLYFYAGERLMTVVVAALICVAFTYGFMDHLMGIPLFEGLLFEYFR